MAAGLRNGSTELHHVAGLYAVLDALRTEMPSVVVDNCAGGGESVDLEMLGRSIKKWRSDYDCTSDTVQHYAIANQVHTMALSFFQPMNGGAVWVSETLCANAKMPLAECHAYQWRSAATTGVAVQWDQRGDSLAMKNLSKLAALETKRLRPLILAGDMHLLTDINMSSSMWAGWQYHDAQARAGAVQLFRREGCVASTFTVALQNLEPGRLWDVSVYGGDGYAHTKTATMTTAELAALRVNVARAPGSAVVFYNQTDRVTT